MQRIFRRRLNDYQKIKTKMGQPSKARPSSLVKKTDLFSPTKKVNQYGGTTSEGPHIKKSEKGEKIYYVSTHDKKEYFSFEILNRIGFNTPKSRMLPYARTLKVASKSVEGYIPITAFIHDRSDKKDVDFSYDPSLNDVHKKYKLDMKNQVVIDLETGEKHKISGNLFASNIGAYLLRDDDFQPEDFNIGLKRIGNRFYTYLIDKEKISFPGETYEKNIDNTDARVGQSKLYHDTSDDQVLYIISEIQKASNSGEFKEIFLNPRIYETSEIRTNEMEGLANNFNLTAQSAITYFSEKAKSKEDNTLESFRKREEWRGLLVDIIINELAIDGDEQEKKDLKEIIMEDLRAPYYKHLFVNKKMISKEDLDNSALINAIVRDQIKELKALGIKSNAILDKPNAIQLYLTPDEKELLKYFRTQSIRNHRYDSYEKLILKLQEDGSLKPWVDGILKNQTPHPKQDKVKTKRLRELAEKCNYEYDDADEIIKQHLDKINKDLKTRKKEFYQELHAFDKDSREKLIAIYKNIFGNKEEKIKSADLLQLITLKKTDGSAIEPEKQNELYNNLDEHPSLSALSKIIKKYHVFAKAKQILQPEDELAEKAKSIEKNNTTESLLIGGDNSDEEDRVEKKEENITGKKASSTVKKNQLTPSQRIEECRKHYNKNLPLILETRQNPVATFFKAIGCGLLVVSIVGIVPILVDSVVKNRDWFGWFDTKGRIIVEDLRDKASKSMSKMAKKNNNQI